MLKALRLLWSHETTDDTRPPLLRYGVAGLGVVLALGFFLLLQRDGFPLLLAVVAFVAWFGGLRPGLLATGSSVFVIIASLLISQNGQALRAGDVERMVLFTLLSFFIGSLTAAFQAARRRAEA